MDGQLILSCGKLWSILGACGIFLCQAEQPKMTVTVQLYHNLLYLNNHRGYLGGHMCPGMSVIRISGHFVPRMHSHP
jgi:hypothetical protein